MKVNTILAVRCTTGALEKEPISCVYLENQSPPVLWKETTSSSVFS